MALAAAPAVVSLPPEPMSQALPHQLQTIVVLSRDERQYNLNSRECQLSKLLTRRLSVNAEETKVDVDSRTLENVIEYMRHHQDTPVSPIVFPLQSNDLSHLVSDPWDVLFVNQFSKSQIFDIVLASDHLQMESLTNLMACKLATLIHVVERGQISQAVEQEETRRRGLRHLVESVVSDDDGVESDFLYHSDDEPGSDLFTGVLNDVKNQVRHLDVDFLMVDEEDSTTQPSPQILDALGVLEGVEHRQIHADDESDLDASAILEPVNDAKVQLVESIFADD